MARAVPKHIVVGLIAALAAAAVPVGSVIAAQSAAPIPDFTGIWGHNAMAPELIPSAACPIWGCRQGSCAAALSGRSERPGRLSKREQNPSRCVFRR
jgi:hypothetical protein